MLKILKPDMARDGMKFEIITLTPAIAEAWLSQNKVNRRLSEREVKKYASDMSAGSWQMTGDPIRFDVDRNLIDGQHRLHACIRSGANFTTLVVYDMPNAVKDVIDSGKTRSAADVLALNGAVNSAALAATSRLLMLERDNYRAKGAAYTNSDVIYFVQKHSNLSLYIVTATLPRGISNANVSALSYMASMTDARHRAPAMVATLTTGVPDYPGDPIHNWRERIMRMKAENDRAGLRAKWNTLKYAWNMFANKMPMQSYLKFLDRHVPVDGFDETKL